MRQEEVSVLGGRRPLILVNQAEFFLIFTHTYHHEENTPYQRCFPHFNLHVIDVHNQDH